MYMQFGYQMADRNVAKLTILASKDIMQRKKNGENKMKESPFKSTKTFSSIEYDISLLQ